MKSVKAPLTHKEAYYNDLSLLMNEHTLPFFSRIVAHGEGTYLKPSTDFADSYDIWLNNIRRGYVTVREDGTVKCVRLFRECFEPGIGVYQAELLGKTNALLGRPLFD